jgi:hypothetical protein
MLTIPSNQEKETKTRRARTGAPKAGPVVALFANCNRTNVRNAMPGSGNGVVKHHEHHGNRKEAGLKR